MAGWLVGWGGRGGVYWGGGRFASYLFLDAVGRFASYCLFGVVWEVCVVLSSMLSGGLRRTVCSASCGRFASCYLFRRCGLFIYCLIPTPQCLSYSLRYSMAPSVFEAFFAVLCSCGRSLSSSLCLASTSAAIRYGCCQVPYIWLGKPISSLFSSCL